MAKKYLYNAGDECTNLTGGWVKGSYTRGSATLTKNTDNMTLSSTASGNQTVTAITTNKIDVTNYKKICFNVEYSLSNAANGLVHLGLVASNANASIGENSYATYYISGITSFSGIAEVDLTNVTGEWYVIANEDRWTSGTATLIVHEVWLEYDGERVFQPGIVGKTNVVEGTVIPDTRGQVINYTMLYDGTLGESGEDGANVCFDVTGGYSSYYRNTSYGHTATYNSDNIHLVKSSARDSANSGINTNNPITLDDYSGFLIKVKARHLSSYTSSYGDRPYISAFVTNKGYVDERLWQIEHKNVTSAEFDGIEFHKKDSTVIGPCYYQIQANGHRGTNLSSSYVYLYAAVLVKEDDYNALCDKAGVSTYATVDALIADTTAISAILSNASAVKFMVKRCTGDFMASFVGSSACLSLLESSPYKETVYANEHWAKFLAMVA